jgi:hypothetical protein
MEGSSFGTLVGKENSPFRPRERVLAETVARRSELVTGIAKNLERRTAREMIGTGLQTGIFLTGFTYFIPLTLMKVFGKQKHSWKPWILSVCTMGAAAYWTKLTGKETKPEDISKISKIANPTGNLAKVQVKFKMQTPFGEEVIDRLASNDTFCGKLANGEASDQDKKQFIATLSPNAKALMQKILKSPGDAQKLAEAVHGCDTAGSKGALKVVATTNISKNIHDMGKTR